IIGFMLTSLNVVNIAIDDLATTKRLATFLRKRVIGTRFSTRSPAANIGASAAGSADFVTTSGLLATAATASSLVTRPSLPVPGIDAGLRAFSSAILRAAGDKIASPVAVAAGAAAFAAGADGAVAAGAAATASVSRRPKSS